MIVYIALLIVAAMPWTLSVDHRLNISQYKFVAQEPRKWVKYNDNPYLSADIRGGSDDNAGDVFLTFHQPVDRHDHFEIEIITTGPSGRKYPPIRGGINLCDQLILEGGEERWAASHGNLFGLNGLRCPISAGRVEDMMEITPFAYPEEHYYYTDVGCGNHEYEVIIAKCSGPNENCVELISAGIRTTFAADHCNKSDGPTEVVDEEPIDDDERMEFITEKTLVIANEKDTIKI